MRETLKRTVASEIAFNQLYERATVKKYPEAEYNSFYSDVTYLEEYAKEQKMTVVEFLAKYGDQFTEFGFEKGMSEEEYKNACKEYAERTTKEDMLMYHLLRELKVKTSGSAYKDMKETLLRDYNMSDVANYEDVYGEGSFDNSMRYNLMLNALYARVVLK
jgi:FKBP-type peptidyl-prolyl cis-trans isomerase (trigger factor)